MSQRRKTNPKQHNEINEKEISGKFPCFIATSQLHDMWHQIVDVQHINSGLYEFDIPESNPQVTVVIIAASVYSKDSEKIGNAAYNALSEKMTETYGASCDTVKQ